MKRKVSIETFGCRYNRLESAEIAYELEKEGYAPVINGDSPDVVVINTCTVTGRSDAKCRAAIRRAKLANPQALVVVAGCYPETNPDEVAMVKGADIVVGNAGKHKIAQALGRLNGAGADKAGRGDTAPTGDMLVRPITRMEGRTNAYLNIQTGCDEACSFCVVRLARGKSRSARPQEVIAQVNRLARAGIKEVALSGINVGEFGKGKDEGLARLIEGILGATKIERIRLSSINPNNVTDELINVMARSSRFCRHLHIPLQSGSDTVLERMRRPYTRKEYEELLARLTGRIPDIGIGADVMVGFPGETDEEFNETLEMIESSPVMMLHVFAYSPRENTLAFDYPHPVTKDKRKRRAMILKELSAKLSRKMRERFTGKTLNVLIENERDREGYLKGFTDNYLPVKLQGSDATLNRIVPVKMISSNDSRLVGAPLEGSSTPVINKEQSPGGSLE